MAAISAGGYHTCVDQHRCNEMLGLNDSGQLGDNSTTTRPTPVDASGSAAACQPSAAALLHTCAGGWRREVLGLQLLGQTVGDNSTTQRQVPTAVSGLGSGVAAIAAGTLHTCALVVVATRAGATTPPASWR